MTFYDDRILPHVINFACSTKPVQEQREKIVPLAEGDVLEIGFGSGLNLPFYNAIAAIAIPDRYREGRASGVTPADAPCRGFCRH